MPAPGAVAECLLPVGLQRMRGRLPYGLVREDVGARGAASEADRPFGHWRSEYTNGAILGSCGDEGREVHGSPGRHGRRSRDLHLRRPTRRQYCCPMPASLELVKIALQAYGNGDSEIALALADPLIRWDERASRPDGDLVWGHDDVQRAMRCYLDSWESYSFDVEDIAEMGPGKVVGICRERGTPKEGVAVRPALRRTLDRRGREDRLLGDLPDARRRPSAPQRSCSAAASRGSRSSGAGRPAAAPAPEEQPSPVEAVPPPRPASPKPKQAADEERGAKASRPGPRQAPPPILAADGLAITR